jgi:hypothetical protein
MLRVVFFCAFLWLHPYLGLAQQGIYQTSRGEVVFFSKAPLENITAKNQAVSSLINTEKNELAFVVRISRFDFPNKLMQQHFNESYLESDKYPTASFKGKINEAIPWEKPGTYPATASGLLSIHGVEVQKTFQGNIVVRANGIQLNSTFKVPLAEHNIKIPTLVFNKIAEEIEVTCQFQYQPYQKN